MEAVVDPAARDDLRDGHDGNHNAEADAAIEGGSVEHGDSGGGGEEEEDDDDEDYGDDGDDDDDEDDPYDSFSFPLHAAVKMDDVEALARLLRKKVTIFYDGTGSTESGPEHDVDARDDDKLAPIHIAILRANAAAVRLLMDAQCNMLQRHVGSTPLHIAVSACAIKSKRSDSLGVLSYILNKMGART